MDETMALIIQLTNEKLALYRLAGQQPLTPQQHERLDILNGQLPMLWDQHRREDAARRWGAKRPADFWQAA